MILKLKLKLPTKHYFYDDCRQVRIHTFASWLIVYSYSMTLWKYPLATYSSNCNNTSNSFLSIQRIHKVVNKGICPFKTHKNNRVGKPFLISDKNLITTGVLPQSLHIRASWWEQMDSRDDKIYFINNYKMNTNHCHWNCSCLVYASHFVSYDTIKKKQSCTVVIMYTCLCDH